MAWLYNPKSNDKYIGRYITKKYHNYFYWSHPHDIPMPQFSSH